MRILCPEKYSHKIEAFYQHGMLCGRFTGDLAHDASPLGNHHKRLNPKRKENGGRMNSSSQIALVTGANHANAIFTQESVNFTSFQGKIDVIIRKDARKKPGNTCGL